VKDDKKTNMQYPKSLAVESVLLRFIFESGGNVLAKDVYTSIGSQMGLSPEDMERTLDAVQGYGGNRRKWDNMVQWARNSLAKKGYLLRPDKGDPHGVWTLTENGMLAAQTLSPLAPAADITIYPDEVPSTVPEGTRRSVLVNVYERSIDGRNKCIDKYGCACVVCGFDFAQRYGERGKGFIHVHHLKPISSIGHEYHLDPIADLRPVCPNCHAMLHRTEPPCSIEELRHSLID
jgi:5-methylcytosine-specific restriction protein A